MSGTKFVEIYDRFFGKITDDMYLELTPEDTVRDLRALMINAIPYFEFPRKRLDYVIQESAVPIDSEETKKWTNMVPEGTELPTEGDNILIDDSYFEEELTSEEINILAVLMVCGWVQRQVTSIENIRTKYSGPDFKMTSQANHLSKLIILLRECRTQSHKLQRLYKRRKTDENGYIHSNWSILRESSALDN